MKKYLLNALMLFTLLLTGSINSWADANEPTVVYERDMSSWLATDIGNNAWKNTLGQNGKIDETYGLWVGYTGGSRTIENTTQIIPSENYIVTYDIVWNVGASYGNNNEAYFKIGNNFKISTSSQGQWGKFFIGETGTTIPNSCSNANGNRSEDVWTIHAVFNTLSNKLKELTIQGKKGTKKVSYTLADPVAMPEGTTYSSMTLGTIRSSSASSLWTAMKSIVVTENNQKPEAPEITVVADGDIDQKITITPNPGEVFSDGFLLRHYRKYTLQDGTVMQTKYSTGTNPYSTTISESGIIEAWTVASDATSESSFETGNTFESDHVKQAVFARAAEWKTAYLQDFEDVKTWRDGWAASGSGSIEQKEQGSGHVFHHNQGGGSGNRTWTFDCTAVSDLFTSGDDYVFEFDFGAASSNQNNSVLTLSAGEATAFTVTHAPGAGEATIADGNGNQLGSFAIDGYTKACPTKLSHFTITATKSGTTLTVKNSEGNTIVNEAKLADGLLQLTTLTSLLGRAESHHAFDNFTLKVMTNKEIMLAPTALISGVNGTSRTFTILPGNSSDDNTVTSYYTTDGSTPDETSNEYAEPFEYDFGATSGTLKVISISNLGTKSPVFTWNLSNKNINTELAELGNIWLNVPTWTKAGRNSATSISTVVLNTDQSAVLCKPVSKIHWKTDSGEGEVENGGTIEVKDNETMTIYAIADGYTNSEEVSVFAKTPYAGAVDWTESYNGTADKGGIALSDEVEINGTKFYKMTNKDDDNLISKRVLAANNGSNVFLYRDNGRGIYDGSDHQFALQNQKAGRYLTFSGRLVNGPFEITAISNLEYDAWNSVPGSRYSFYVVANGDVVFQMKGSGGMTGAMLQLSESESDILDLNYVDEAGILINHEQVGLKKKPGALTSKTFSKFMNFNGVWYEYMDEPYYRQFGAAETTTHTINFKEASTVKAFIEAEECHGNNANVMSSYNANLSGCYAAALKGENAQNRGVTIATLPAGIYEFRAKLTADVKHAICLRDRNNASYQVAAVTGKTGEEVSAIFKIWSETELIVTGPDSGNKTNITEEFDYCYITKGNDEYDFTKYTEYTAKSDEVNPIDGYIPIPLLANEGSTIEVSDLPEDALFWKYDNGVIDLRVNQDDSFIITPSSVDLAIRRISFAGSGLDMTASSGNIVTMNNNKVWTGNANKVKFTAKNNLSISYVLIWVEKSNSETENFEDQPKSADKLVVATDIAAFKALADSTEAKLTLTDAVVTFVNGKNIYLEDATGAIVLYDMGLELTEGQKLNGLLAGKTVNYFALPEMVKTDSTKTDTFTAEAGEVKATTMALADICKVENLARLITISNVTIDVVDNNIFATSGDEKLQVYNKFKVDGLDLQKGNVYTSITGILVPWQNKETLEITYELAPRTLADLVLDADATGISELAGEKAAREVYNLNGQRVNATKKGLYIINGKKVMVK